jgi:hypothetical protein
MARNRIIVAACGLAIGLMLALGGVQPSSAAPPTMESLFAEAVRPEPARIKSAREAAKRGNADLAIADYLASIQDDGSTGDAAIDEMVEVFLAEAEKCEKNGHDVEQSIWVNRCRQTLLQVKQTDSNTRTLSEPARADLFKQIDVVHQYGTAAANRHTAVADLLRRQGTGKHFWNWNDRDKLADALHHLNIAWSYYLTFTGEDTTSKMYDLWAELKSALPAWRYEQVMERDRLQIGRVFGDR